MKLHQNTVQKLSHLHNWAKEINRPFTQAEMLETLGYKSRSTAKVDLKMLVNMHLLTYEKQIVNKCIACVYTLGPKKDFPEMEVSKDIRKYDLPDIEWKPKRVVKIAQQEGVTRPWYISMLFGDWKAA